MNVEIILVLASACLAVALFSWGLLGFLAASKEKQKQLSQVLKNPLVRSIILQLLHNQYYSDPANPSERRSNSRRALAVIRLRKIVKDPRIRKQIYKLTDTKK